MIEKFPLVLNQCPRGRISVLFGIAALCFQGIAEVQSQCRKDVPQVEQEILVFGGFNTQIILRNFELCIAEGSIRDTLI